MLRAAAIGLACLAVIGSSSRRAYAQEVEPIALSYSAPNGCPDQSALHREILARTSKARIAPTAEASRALDVTIVSRKSGGFTGRLHIEEKGTRSTAREVSGATCSEVIEALGLIAALAVDPKASTAPKASIAAAAPRTGTSPGSSSAAIEPPAASSAGGSGSTSASASASTSTAPSGATAAEAVDEARRTTSAPPALPRPETSRATSSPSDRRGRFGVGAHVEASFIADAVPAGRLFGDIALGIFVLRASASASLDVERVPPVGRASFRFLQGGLDGCVFRFDLGSTLHARPCVGGSAGVVLAEGQGVNNAQTRGRPWAALSAAARLVWEPIRTIAPELEVGILTPLVRESFFFAPTTPIYSAPAAAFFARMGLSVRFP